MSCSGWRWRLRNEAKGHACHSGQAVIPGTGAGCHRAGDGRNHGISERRLDICYEESDLTGLRGVTTTFRVEPEQITLTRTGNLSSQMVFRKGQSHDSLYQMDFGALMITVCATSVIFDLTPAGGFIDLVYTIEIEKSEAGFVDYHLDIRAMEE